MTGGVADSATQDSFCSGGATCTISKIYDQSPNKNDLNPSPPGGAKGSADSPANATDLKTTLGGHEVYGIYIKPGMGYRAGCSGCGVVTPKGTATGDQAETEYMVTSKNGVQGGCCFDYGNAETDSHDDGNGTMEAVYFGDGVVWGTGTPGGHNNGTSWVEANLENGLYAGWSSSTQDQDIPTNTVLNTDFITAIVVGDSCTGKAGCAGTGPSYPNGRFALYGGDATTGTLKTLYDGIRPAKDGYVPMAKQGSIILGTGEITATATVASGSRVSWRAELPRWPRSTRCRPTLLRRDTGSEPGMIARRDQGSIRGRAVPGVFARRGPSDPLRAGRGQRSRGAGDRGGNAASLARPSQSLAVRGAGAADRRGPGGQDPGRGAGGLADRRSRDTSVRPSSMGISGASGAG